MSMVRRALRCAAATTLVVGAVLTAAPAHAGGEGDATNAVTVTGAQGQKLTVTPTTDLNPAGQAVQVTGAGFDNFKGVYVALCLVPEPGKQPTPCGGGIDMSGESQTSAWISSNAPSYAEGLAQPFGPDGSFQASVWAGSALPNGQDCRQVACAIVSRADHLRTSDRSQDVLVPVTFAAEAPAASSGAGPALLAGVGVAVLVLLASIPLGVTLTARRRRAGRTFGLAVSEAP